VLADEFPGWWPHRYVLVVGYGVVADVGEVFGADLEGRRPSLTATSWTAMADGGWCSFLQIGG